MLSGKHSIHTHFPKDRNCDICQRTKITRDPCRRRIGRVVTRAENFGDLITADHKVLSEGSESRNNHQETEKNLQKFLEPTWKPKVVYIDNSQEFGKACEDLGIIVRRHRTDRKRMGLLRDQCAESRKGPLLYCCNQVWMNNGGRIPWSATAICETFKISCLMEAVRSTIQWPGYFV